MSTHKIAIVGGAGFVGASLARYLADSYEVRVLDKNPVPTDIRDKVKFELCDVSSRDDVRRALKGAELVIHTAIIQIPQINEMKRLGYAVNVAGIQNVCEAVDELESVRGMLLTGSWHVFGEKDFRGTVDESFGSRPDKVDGRARLYALCKIAQETLVRIYDEMSRKTYGVVRIGTVLGEGMPEKTAANIFISKGLRGEPLTPYRNSMYRPMLYVDVKDVCRAFEAFARRILDNGIDKNEGSLGRIVNMFWPTPITILELANIVRERIVKCSAGGISPEIRIVDTGEPLSYSEDDKKKMSVDIGRARDFLGMTELNSPEQTIDRIVLGLIHN
jgi:nucleoside-diphosphate-sugar epimerase